MSLVHTVNEDSDRMDGDDQYQHNHDNDVPLLDNAVGHQPCIPYRYITAVLAFGGFFCAQGARSCFNIALVAMINYTAEAVPINISSQCPDPHSYTNQTSPDLEGEFNWDGSVQSQLLSGFFYGYVITQFPGGYIAERFGSTWVFGMTVLIPGILVILHPLLAHWDYRALLVARIIMGLCQGPLYPANQALWGKWAPPLERSRLIALSISGSVMGITSAMMLTGYLCSLPYLGGWPLPFYVWGSLSCVWFIIWRIFSADSPNKSRMISIPELQYIELKTGNLNIKPYVQPPWCAILSSKPLWALVVYLVCDGIGYYVIFSGFPVYLKQVLHYDITQDGQLAAMPYLACVIIALLSGPLADYILSRRYLSVTGVRKLFTVIGEGGTALALIGMGLVECDHVLAVVLLIIGYGLNGFTAAGIAVVTLDMAPQYAGTLLGMTNCINNIGGFLSPTIVGAITDNQGDKTRWQLVFYLTGGCYIFGIIVFLLFGSAKEQSWAITPDIDYPDIDDPDGPDDPEHNRHDTDHLVVNS